jgi:hypothetical protein
MSTIRSFFAGIVDYAGLFPPARLPLDQALLNYTRYRSEKDAWLLGHIVCPASRLAELVSLIPGSIRRDQPLVIAALGRGGRDAEEYRANIQADLADIARCRVASAGRVVVEAYEVRLPESEGRPDGGRISSLIAAANDLIEASGPPSLAPFFEAPAADRDVVLAIIEALQGDQQAAEVSARRHCKPAGIKLRTGGPEPASIPSSKEIALVLAACAKNRVAFKATAGLHHPFRHSDSASNTAMHGFVNVFGAGCLALVHNLDAARIVDIVEDENPADFHFEQDNIRWRDLTATATQLTEARTVFISFGSCSFDEPREDLRRFCRGMDDDIP